MSLLSYFIWNVDPEFFTIPLIDRPVRWYGLLFAMGFLISQQILFYIYKKEGKPEKNVETLTVFMVVATIIGARLGHVFFYEPEKYLANPIDIIKIWEGGLASHGAAFGILFALWLYSRYDINWKLQFKRLTRPGENYLQVVDRIVIVVALTGCLIRFGNFMNSEIYGVPTESEYGTVFTRNIGRLFDDQSSPVENMSFSKDESRSIDAQGHVPVKIDIEFLKQPEIITKESTKGYLETRFKSILSGYAGEHIYQTNDGDMPFEIRESNGKISASVQTYGIARHPTQLYESFTSLAICLLLFLIWTRRKEHTSPGLLLGIFLILLFGLRFVHELFKENQVAFEDGMNFNMGQLLSIPLIIAGIIILVRALLMKNNATLDE